MRFGGRLQAAIEILSDIAERHRPASEALADWGRSHRFAGSGDRAAIGNLVYDVLRNRASLAWQMGEEVGAETPRALALGCVAGLWNMSVSEIETAFAEDHHAPKGLTDLERAKMSAQDMTDAPNWVVANTPNWLAAVLEDSFEDSFVAEMQAMALRPPVDLRVNTLKADRDKVLKALQKFNPQKTNFSPIGLRLSAGQAANARVPNIQPEACYQKGWVEVQDEGSQIAAQLVFAKPGEKVLDFCAGAGGKTLALAAAMENKGQVFAYDHDRNRLKPIYERIKRAGTRNVQVIAPQGDGLKPLLGTLDRVIIDAPCTGSGTWRRRPDTKWRLTPETLDKRLAEQVEVLSSAAPYVRPGGYLCYITCSILPQENEGQIYQFLDENKDFTLLSAGEVWEELYGADRELMPWSSDGCTVAMTPASTQTDGFFFAVLERNK